MPVFVFLSKQSQQDTFGFIRIQHFKKNKISSPLSLVFSLLTQHSLSVTRYLHRRESKSLRGCGNSNQNVFRVLTQFKCRINYKSLPAACCSVLGRFQTNQTRSRWVDKFGPKTERPTEALTHTHWHTERQIQTQCLNNPHCQDEREVSLSHRPTNETNEKQGGNRKKSWLPGFGQSPWPRHSTPELRTLWLCQPGKYKHKFLLTYSCRSYMMI